MSTNFTIATRLLTLLCLLAACAESKNKDTTPKPTFKPPEGALVSVKATVAPTLDGTANDAAWSEAPAKTISLSGGANNGQPTVTMRSVYMGDTVYFVATWADPTESFFRSPWQKQTTDGSWKMLKDPDDEGGDNNEFYEDKFSLIWSIGNSIANFDTQGCMAVCHAGENSEVKPFGNKYTSKAGEKGDMWHWKSVRNLGQVDDQYVDHTRYSADTPNAGRKSDKSDGGGYADNVSADGSVPAYMPPAGGSKDGAPGFILDSEKVVFDDALFTGGDLVPSVVKAPFEGDRGNISAGWAYAGGTWTLEFSRKLTTGSDTDVQFDNLEGTYYFGTAAFDNAQVRHAFQGGAATPFVFKP